MESSGSVKVDRDGNGLAALWRKQLQQFRNVSADVVNAIVAEYSTPQSLWQVCRHLVFMYSCMRMYWQI